MIFQIHSRCTPVRTPQTGWISTAKLRFRAVLRDREFPIPMALAVFQVMHGEAEVFWHIAVVQVAFDWPLKRD
jgi:hypothetical protein